MRKSITGQYLSGRKFIPVPLKRRPGNGKVIRLEGASDHNLKHINVDFPLGKFIVVSGVSGSGKSTLVNSILRRALAQKLNHNSEKPGPYDKILGYKNIEKLINIDQVRLGVHRGVIRQRIPVFLMTFAVCLRKPMKPSCGGIKKGRFSFNIKGGRCENCKGDGIIKIEMNFLPDVYVPCEVCHGKRYNSETLEVTYKGKNIAEVLDMTVEEATAFFKNIPKIRRKLQTIVTSVWVM